MQLYSIKLYIGIVVSITFASSTRVPSISVEHFSNGAQFLNTICVAQQVVVFLTELLPSAAIVLVTVIFAATKIYASE